MTIFKGECDWHLERTQKKTNRTRTLPNLGNDNQTSTKVSRDGMVGYYSDMVRNGVSFVSLSGVLLTYALFKELRTTAGKNIMALASFMLVTCVLHTLELSLCKNGILCISISLGLQWAYLIKCVLTTPMTATDVYRTFGRKKHDSKNQ